MSVLKAFGLNGFLTLFYEKYWRITINVVRKCSHKSQCNAGVSKKKKSVVEASMVVKIQCNAGVSKCCRGKHGCQNRDLDRRIAQFYNLTSSKHLESH